MKKKWTIAAALVAAMILVIMGANLLMPKPVEGEKNISITVVNEVEGTEMFKGEFNTDAETLGAFLDEAEELKAVMEDSTYGRLLTSLLDLEQGAMETGPWWLYESDNNEACKAAGFCPAVDDTPIQDADHFTFKFTDSY